MSQWQTMETAPKDGSDFWGWLSDSGIHRMRFMTAEEAADVDGGDPADFDEGWVTCVEPDDYWTPAFWCPLDAIPAPPNEAWTGSRYRPEARTGA